MEQLGLKRAAGIWDAGTTSREIINLIHHSAGSDERLLFPYRGLRVSQSPRQGKLVVSMHPALPVLKQETIRLVVFDCHHFPWCSAPRAEQQANKHL